MKYAILSSVAVSLILGGCSAPQFSGTEYNPAAGQYTVPASSGVSAFPANLHGAQPYMARPGSLPMQQCAVTATAFEPPPVDGAPMRMIAASCWL
jgi:hypothetical protein